ncbi:MAG: enoyl-CoA hydratase/isomerase family protein [Bradymonadales bacterium]|nr:MAG: enoyl-CoA hydratase/isomerase family protein [Bradymonadales bacterium]
MYQTIQIEDRELVRHIVLNRPEFKNAMNEVMIQELADCFKKLPQTVRVVVLKGSGDFYCAGGDLNWMKSSVEKSVEENREDALKLGKMLRFVNECPIPVMSIVKGGAFGGGVGLVAASDIVIADERAKFSLSEVKLGLIPATIGPIVMRKIGISQARRLYLTGLRFTSQEAKAMGLVHESVPASSILSVTNEYLREFESSGPEAVRTAKSLIFRLQSGSLWNEDISESTSELLSKVRVGDEAQEGISAFLEKRQAKWRHKLLP